LDQVVLHQQSKAIGRNSLKGDIRLSSGYQS
jgi:hypothetical protein